MPITQLCIQFCRQRRYNSVRNCTYTVQLVLGNVSLSLSYRKSSFASTCVEEAVPEASKTQRRISSRGCCTTQCRIKILVGFETSTTLEKSRPTLRKISILIFCFRSYIVVAFHQSVVLQINRWMRVSVTWSPTAVLNRQAPNQLAADADNEYHRRRLKVHGSRASTRLSLDRNCSRNYRRL